MNPQTTASITNQLTILLGRAPTSDEIANAATDANVLYALNASISTPIIDSFLVSNDGNITVGGFVMLLDDGTIAMLGNATPNNSLAWRRTIGISVTANTPSNYAQVMRSGTYYTTGLSPGSFYYPSNTLVNTNTIVQSLSNSDTDLVNIIGQTFIASQTYLTNLTIQLHSPLGAGTYGATFLVRKNGPTGDLIIQHPGTFNVTLSSGGTFNVTLNSAAMQDANGNYALLTPGQTYYIELSGTAGQLNIHYQNTAVYANGTMYSARAAVTGDIYFTITENSGDGTMVPFFGDGLAIATSATNLELLPLPSLGA